MPNRKKVLKVDESITLHLPESNMAQELFDLIDQEREYLGRWLIWVKNTSSINDSHTFLKEAGIFNRGGQRLTTFIKYNKKIVGSVAFVKLDKTNKCGEIGYWISENMQGRGIITKSCEKLIEYAFKHLDLNRIVIKMDAQNTKSKAIPIRMGFTYEGKLRQDRFINDHFRDTDLYSLLKKEWIATKTAI
jgi:ribosomal-protein-serine acetyltransferase